MTAPVGRRFPNSHSKIQPHNPLESTNNRKSTEKDSLYPKNPSTYGQILSPIAPFRPPVSKQKSNAQANLSLTDDSGSSTSSLSDEEKLQLLATAVLAKFPKYGDSTYDQDKLMAAFRDKLFREGIQAKMDSFFTQSPWYSDLHPESQTQLRRDTFLMFSDFLKSATGEKFVLWVGGQLQNNFQPGAFTAMPMAPMLGDFRTPRGV
jgi:hypothetical protein